MNSIITYLLSLQKKNKKMDDQFNIPFHKNDKMQKRKKKIVLILFFLHNILTHIRTKY